MALQLKDDEQIIEADETAQIQMQPDWTNRQKFEHVYPIELRRAILEKPEDYGSYGDNLDAMVQVTVSRMIPALAQGTANADGRAIRRTCRILGIKNTIRAIKEYLS